MGFTKERISEKLVDRLVETLSLGESLFEVCCVSGCDKWLGEMLCVRLGKLEVG